MCLKILITNCVYFVDIEEICHLDDIAFQSTYKLHQVLKVTKYKPVNNSLAMLEAKKEDKTFLQSQNKRQTHSGTYFSKMLEMHELLLHTFFLAYQQLNNRAMEKAKQASM